MDETTFPGTDESAESDVEKELERVRGERAALALRREQREARTQARAELERERRALADELAVEAAIEKHGTLDRDITHVHTDLGVVILKRPSSHKFRRFQDKASYKSDDVLGLVRPCVVHPSLPELDRILDELPATLSRLANALVTLAGQRAEELAKK